MDSCVNRQMSGQMDVQMSGCLNGQGVLIDVWMDEWMYGSMDGLVDVWMGELMNG